jgi:hypothetical protein
MGARFGVTRRRFLVGAVAASGVLFARALADPDIRRYYGLAAIGPLHHHGSRIVNAVWPPARRIRRHFSYLTFADGTIERFVADFNANIGIVPVGTSSVYMRFLMSTDFFQHGADESRTIGYALFYEPTITPCYNPFTSQAARRPSERGGSA